jgi:hypothetical protein
MRTEVMQITPSMADVFLKQNIGNRAVRQGWVNELAGFIESNQWKTSHQGIAFDKGGRLLDGQHRLMAVLKANRPVKMNVTFEADAESFSVMDQGQRRTAADILSVDRRHAEIVRLAVRTMTNSTRVTPLDLQTMHAAIGPTCSALVEHCGRANRFFSTAPMKLAAVARVLGGADRDYVFGLYSDLVLGNIDALPPIGKGLVKQYVRGALDTGDVKDKLARGFLVFNPDSRDTTRVQVKDCDVSVEAIRNILRSVV